jgi:hypothetical protein
VRTHVLSVLAGAIEACGAGDDRWQGLALGAASFAEDHAKAMTRQSTQDGTSSETRKRAVAPAALYADVAGTCRDAVTLPPITALELLRAAHARVLESA